MITGAHTISPNLIRQGRRICVRREKDHSVLLMKAEQLIAVSAIVLFYTIHLCFLLEGIFFFFFLNKHFFFLKVKVEPEAVNLLQTKQSH